MTMFKKDAFIRYYEIVKGTWHWHPDCQHIKTMRSRVVGGTGFKRQASRRYPVRPATGELCNECLGLEKKERKA